MGTHIRFGHVHTNEVRAIYSGRVGGIAYFCDGAAELISAYLVCRMRVTVTDLTAKGCHPCMSRDLHSFDSLGAWYPEAT